MSTRRIPYLVLALLISLSAIQGVAAASSTPEASPTDETMTVSVYFLRETRLGKAVGTAHREIEIPEGKTVAKSAITELLAGPTDEEAEIGLDTAIPEKTKLKSINLVSETKVATIDLSKEFTTGDSETTEAQVAQVVYTLTQFPTIEKVAFQIDDHDVDKIGDVDLAQPVDRTNFEAVTPLIFVESPAPFDDVSVPLQITGTANTFEAMFQADVLDEDGNMLVHKTMMATSGSGTRGTFDETLDFTPPESGEITLKVYELSAKDGAVVNDVEIPLTVGD
jgi:Immunoglobulin-like domain of bacterial spore germination/Sporulation and spore germination